MNLREALSAALLFIIAFSPLGISQDVPDDVVYTEVKKTLVNGSKGVLTCRFKGSPFAVYWKKGSDPENSPSIITWGYGNKGGPRYEDGGCDIDENHSLIIKNVTYEDEGRYICRVSSYKGVLIHNYTDVTITSNAVKTDQSVLVQKGKVGVLPCEVNIRPRRVSWLRSYNKTLVTMDLSHNFIERSELGQFNITEDYSLVIYNVAVQHKDEYFCEVADYDTGITYQDATLLNVYAYPREPFPSIKECPVNISSSCTLRIQSDTTLTCQVEGYYPHIDLYFVHGSDRVETLGTGKWNNSDGTLNKLIEIHVDGTGEISFECVATGLIGQVDSGSMTIHLIPHNKQSHTAVAVVVPLILVSAVVAIALLVFKRRKTLLKRKYKRVPMVYKPKQEDLISCIEIWMLVKDVFQRNLLKNLAKVLDYLLDDEASSGTLRTEKDHYKLLCKWKKGYSGASQRKDFFDACRNQGLDAAIDQLKDYSDSPREVRLDDLEHTLWHVGESERITELLKELGALPEQVNGMHDKSKNDVIVGAMNILKYWRDVNSTGNEEVLLSLALEKINYSPNDEDFFRIPEDLKRGLDRQEIRTLLSEATSRHCTVLVDAMVKLKEKYVMMLLGSRSKDVWLDDVIQKNRTDMFDSHQMIEDWWAEQNCSNYEKRCKLHRADEIINDQDTKILTEPRRDHKDTHDERSDDTLNYVDLEASGAKWPSTKKLKQIVNLVPQPELKHLWNVLHISYDSDDLTCERKRLELMCKWRDGFTTLEEKYKRISTALKSIGFDGFLYRPKGKFIYKAELVDMALDLIMEDFRPFALALGIKGTRLTSYRRAFLPSNLERGTISLVFQLAKLTGIFDFTTAKRSNVCNILNEAGYRNVTTRFKFASEPGYGELFALQSALTQGDKPKVDVVSHKSTGEMSQATKSNNNGAADPEQSPHGAAAQGDKPIVAPQETTGKNKADKRIDNSVGTNGERSPSGADTHARDVESMDDVVSNVSNIPIRDMKLAEESNNNLEFKMGHFTSEGAAAQGNAPEDEPMSHKPTEKLILSMESNSNLSVEMESHCLEDVKREELRTGKEMTVADRKIKVSADFHATGRVKKLGKKGKQEEYRQIPNNKNDSEKLQAGLNETSKSDATQPGSEVGHQDSEETSKEKSPTQKSQSDRKNEPLQGHSQETPWSEATLTLVDGEETQTKYVSGTEGTSGKSVDDLQRILGLTDEDIPESSTNPILMMFKIWKERICPRLTDHRVVLAEGIKKIGKPHLVHALLNGEYHSNKTSIEFIEDMLKGMNEDRRTSLEGLLKNEDKKKWPKSSSGIAQAICDWVADWAEEVKPTVAHQVRDAFLFTEKSKKHRDFNNKLVEHGFLDLAREIMNIEEYWLTT